MTTSLATLSSTSLVTWLRPYFSTTGFLPDFPSLPAFFASASSMRRAFFASRVSGMYFLQSLSTCAAWFLSMAQLNWLIAGGTFKRINIIFLAFCKRTYLGHLTKRVKSRLGWMAPPRRKLRGVFSKSGLRLAAFFFFAAKGAEGNFFLPPAACLPIFALMLIL